MFDDEGYAESPEAQEAGDAGGDPGADAGDGGGRQPLDRPAVEPDGSAPRLRRMPLLEALEHAMIADGQPAVGLAAAVRDLRTINPTFSTGGPRIVVDRLEGDPPLGVAAPKPA